MHIVYLVMDPGVPIGGTKGAAVHVESITAALAAAGHRVTILAARRAEPASPRAGEPGAPGPGEPAAPGPWEPASSCPVELIELDAGQRRAIRDLKGLVRAHRPDYRVDRDLRACLLAGASAPRLAAQLERLAPDAVLERLSLFGVAGLEAARRTGVPHALEMNAPLAGEAQRHRGLCLAPLAAALEQHVLRETDCVFPVSDDLVPGCRAAGVAPERIHVVPNGVDPGRFRCRGRRRAVRAELGLAHADRVVGMVSSLKPWHGGLDLVRAGARLVHERPELHLLVVGDGPERRAMEAAAAESGFGARAHFTGAVAHERVPALVEAMDVAVAPYRQSADFYFSPLKVYEAMAMGRAVVASALGQIEAVIRDGESGRLVVPGDAAALGYVLDELLGDAAACRRLGRAARRQVEERHTWAQAAGRIAAVLDGLREVGSCSASC